MNFTASDIKDLKEVAAILDIMIPVVVDNYLPLFTEQLAPKIGQLIHRMREFSDQEIILSVKRFKDAGLTEEHAFALATNNKHMVALFEGVAGALARTAD